MSGKYFESNTKDFENDVLKSDTLVVVYFYSEDCSICRAVSPILDRVAEKYEGFVKFVKIHRQQNRQLAETYNIKTSPSLVFFKDGNEVCSRLYGYISKAELEEEINSIQEGACIRKERQQVYCDVLILGAGPAGLSAAIYAARAKLYTVVVDEGIPGGQVATTFHVANYPGTNGVVRGLDLVENMKKQAESLGAQIDDMQGILEVSLEGAEKHVKAEDTDYFAKSVIIATGATPRKLPSEGEREFRGRGVHYCATCDGAMYQDADVLVIGGGNSAVEEAVFLTRYAKNVTIIHQFDHFQSSKTAADEALEHPNISVIWDSEVRSVNGDSFVKSAVIENIKTKETREINTDALFVYIGMQPKTDFLKGAVNLNGWGYIITDEGMRTNIPGVFAAGDVREKQIRQIATAASDGVIAGIMVEKYLNGK